MASAYHHTASCAPRISCLFHKCKQHWQLTVKDVTNFKEFTGETEQSVKEFVTCHKDYFKLENETVLLKYYPHSWPSKELEKEALDHIISRVKRHKKIKLQNLCSHFDPTSVPRSLHSLPNLQANLINLVVQNAKYFIVCDGNVIVVAEKLDHSSPKLLNQKGVIDYILFGHGVIQTKVNQFKEKVYFSVAVLPGDIYFTPGMEVTFDAVPSPPGKAYKWKATKICYDRPTIKKHLSKSVSDLTEIQTKQLQERLVQPILDVAKDSLIEEKEGKEKEDLNVAVNVPFNVKDKSKSPEKEDPDEPQEKNTECTETGLSHVAPAATVNITDASGKRENEKVETSGQVIESKNIAVIDTELEKYGRKLVLLEESFMSFFIKYNETTAQLKQMETNIGNHLMEVQETKQLNSDTLVEVKKLEESFNLVKDTISQMQEEYTKEKDKMLQSQQHLENQFTEMNFKLEEVHKRMSKQFDDLNNSVKQTAELRDENVSLKGEIIDLKYTTKRNNKLLKDMQSQIEYLQKKNDQLNTEIQEGSDSNRKTENRVKVLEDQLVEVMKRLPPPVKGDLFIEDNFVHTLKQLLPNTMTIISLPKAEVTQYEILLRKEQCNFKQTYMVLDITESNFERMKNFILLAKQKSTISISVSSVLPDIGDTEKSCSINKSLENFCKCIDAQFVNNDLNFRNFDGSVKEEYYSDKDSTLNHAGKMRLLKNLGIAGLTTTKTS